KTVAGLEFYIGHWPPASGLGGEPNMKLGFKGTKSKTGQVLSNPQGGLKKPLDSKQQHRDDIMRKASPSFSFALPHAALSSSSRACPPFGAPPDRTESYWGQRPAEPPQQGLNLPPGHAERRHEGLSTSRSCNDVVGALRYGTLGLYAKPPSNQDAR